MDAKRCSQCGGVYPIAFFRNNKVGHMHMTRSRCKGCEQTERDAKKRDDRWIVKASNSLYRHAKRLHEQKKIQSPEELTELYGWNARQLAHDFEHAYGNGCPFCLVPFADMPNGLADVTIDILDTRKPPYYRTNTKIACMTCNRNKGDMSPEEFEEFLKCWELWSVRDAERKRKKQQMLFCLEDPS